MNKSPAKQYAEYMTRIEQDRLQLIKASLVSWKMSNMPDYMIGVYVKLWDSYYPGMEVDYGKIQGHN